jgi:hypothetical protein
MEVRCHHREGHVALEAVDAVIRTAVHTMGLKRIDRRLYGGMATA